MPLPTPPHRAWIERTLDASLSGSRAVVIALALTGTAATIGLGVSWATERAAAPAVSSAAGTPGDAPTRLAYSRSSARVSGDFGAP